MPEGIEVPEGMVSFKLTGRTYAKVACTNKSISVGYSQLFDWIHKQGYKQLDGACSIEIFYIEQLEEEK